MANKEKKFSPKKAFSGFIFGGFTGFLFYLQYSGAIDVTGMSGEQKNQAEAQAKILFIAAVAVFAVLGALWKGFRATREKFSVGGAALGAVIGLIVGSLFWVVFWHTLNGLAMIESIMYFSYYAFMLTGFILAGYFLRDWIPFAKSKKDDKYGDLWKM